jgi:hypothetical protein
MTWKGFSHQLIISMQSPKWSRHSPHWEDARFYKFMSFRPRRRRSHPSSGEIITAQVLWAVLEAPQKSMQAVARSF